MSKLLYTTESTESKTETIQNNYEPNFWRKKNEIIVIILYVLFFFLLRKIYKSVPMDSDIDKTSFGCGIMTRDFLQGFMTNKIWNWKC